MSRPVICDNCHEMCGEDYLHLTLGSDEWDICVPACLRNGVVKDGLFWDSIEESHKQTIAENE